MKGLGGQTKKFTNNLFARRTGLHRGSFMSMKGYTITEAMVFLAVSGAIFFMIAGTFNRRQLNAEFMTAARDMESRFQDILNDVSTGYYNHPGNFTCINDSGSPKLNVAAPGQDRQGTSAGCIFIGKFLHLDVDGSDGKAFNVYTAVGVRKNSSNQDVKDLDEASPKVLEDAGLGIDLTEVEQVPPALVIDSVYAEDVNGNKTDHHGVGIFTTFEGASEIPSASSVDAIPLTGTDGSKSRIIEAVNSISNATPKNPAGGVYVCMNSTTTSQYALFVLGANKSRLTTEVRLEIGQCP